jgi:DNA invertase Pin-like site-specific DNA recombinase
MTGTNLQTKAKPPPETRRLGYARVSTYRQTLDAQLAQLRAEGCARIYREKASGTRPDRRELLKLLKALTPATW